MRQGGTEDLGVEGSAQQPPPRNTNSKRSRAAEVHNLSEKVFFGLSSSNVIVICVILTHNCKSIINSYQKS